MEKTAVLKAIADETRMKILTMLLNRNYCVRALARNLELTEATISQHLKVLREAGLLVGEKRGYFMHYDVEKKVLRELAGELEALTDIERKPCTPAQSGCHSEHCHAKSECDEAAKELCHGKEANHHYHRNED